MIKNWRLNLLGLIFFCLFCALGCWQLLRAQEKETRLHEFNARQKSAPLSNHDLSRLQDTRDLRFYLADLQGSFDHAHTFLLDNRTFKGKVGYEIYTPYRLKNEPFAILVDRGFVPLIENNRSEKPKLTFPDEKRLNGLLNLPPHYYHYSKTKMIPNRVLEPFIRIEYFDKQALTRELPYALSPYVLQLHPSNRAAYAIEWQMAMMPKEKHLGYALQWFALALTLLVLLVALNGKKGSSTGLK